MNVAVLSGTGQIGFSLLKRIDRKKHVVSATAFSHKNILTGSTRLDLRDKDQVRCFIRETKPNLFYLVSGLSSADACEKNPQEAMLMNAEMPGFIASELRQLSCKMVFFSSAFVFDGKQSSYSEMDEAKPLSVYGSSKLEGESRVMAELKDMALIVRTIVVYGPDPQDKNFLCQLLKNVEEEKVMRVPNDQVSNPIYNDDLANAVQELVGKNANGIWNVAGPETLDRYSFAKKACAILGVSEGYVRGTSSEEMGYDAPRPKCTVLNIQKLQRLIPSFHPRSVEQGIEATVRWYRQKKRA